MLQVHFYQTDRYTYCIWHRERQQLSFEGKLFCSNVYINRTLWWIHNLL